MIETVLVLRARCDWPTCGNLLGEEDGDHLHEHRDDLTDRLADDGWIMGVKNLIFCPDHPTSFAEYGYWSATELDPGSLRLLGPGQAPGGWEPLHSAALLIDLDGIAVYSPLGTVYPPERPPA